MNQTLLLWILGLEYLMIVIPLIFLVKFLIKHYHENGEASKLRKILIYISLAKILYFLGNIWTVIISLRGGMTQTIMVMSVFAITTILITISNWYAFYIIKQIQKGK